MGQDVRGSTYCLVKHGNEEQHGPLLARMSFLLVEEATMRMMLRFSLPIDKGNQAFKDGSLRKTLESVMEKLKPEAAYFGPTDGKRGGMMFFDLMDTSQIVEIAEPLFSNLNASIELLPVMNADDLRNGLAKVNS